MKPTLDIQIVSHNWKECPTILMGPPTVGRLAGKLWQDHVGGWCERDYLWVNAVRVWSPSWPRMEIIPYSNFLATFLQSWGWSGVAGWHGFRGHALTQYKQCGNSHGIFSEPLGSRNQLKQQLSLNRGGHESNISGFDWPSITKAYFMAGVLG